MFVRVALFSIVAVACAAPALAHETKGGVPVTDADGHVHIHVPGPSVEAQTGISSPDEDSYDTQTMTSSIARPSCFPDEHIGHLSGENDLLPVLGPTTVALTDEIPAAVPSATAKPPKKKPVAKASTTEPDTPKAEPIKKKKLTTKKKPAAQLAKLAAKSEKRTKVKVPTSAPAVIESLY